MMPTRLTSAVRTSNLHTTENGKTAGISVAMQKESPRTAPAIHTSRFTVNSTATLRSEKKLKTLFFVFAEFSILPPPRVVIIFIRCKYYYIDVEGRYTNEKTKASDRAISVSRH